MCLKCHLFIVIESSPSLEKTQKTFDESYFKLESSSTEMVKLFCLWSILFIVIILRVLQSSAWADRI